MWRRAGRPWASWVDLDLNLALATDEPVGGVQEQVAQMLGFDLGQVAAEEDGLGPGDPTSGCQRELQPDPVDRVSRDRKRPMPVCLIAFDSVLDPGVDVLSDFQERQLSAVGVGGHTLVAPPVVGFHQGEFRTGVGSFAADQTRIPSVQPAWVKPGSTKVNSATWVTGTPVWSTSRGFRWRQIAHVHTDSDSTAIASAKCLPRKPVNRESHTSKAPRHTYRPCQTNKINSLPQQIGLDRTWTLNKPRIAYRQGTSSITSTTPCRPYKINPPTKSPG
jgi:hypothetical protein